MAWRDSRRNRGRLLLFISSIVIGITALVAISSFSENLQRDISSEAKTLLGADLLVQGGQPAGDSIQQLFRELKASSRSEVQGLVSMVYFPKNGGTRLSQVRAQEGGFPFYGNLSTEPASAAALFKKSCSDSSAATPLALVEKTLLLQFQLQPGDTVRVGNLSFRIAGQLNAAPGRAGIAGSVAPVVYIPKQFLEKTGLVQRGSLIWYQYFFRLPDNADIAAMVRDQLEPGLENTPLELETVADRQENLGEALGNMRTFLQLVGFIALLLGSIGVASSVHIYLKDKMASIAVLRCIGLKSSQAFQIYLLQVLTLGLLGGLLGALFGSLLQRLLPVLLAEFLPLGNVSREVSWTAIGTGLLTGLGMTLLFSLLPLLAIRRVSPLLTLRAAWEENSSSKDPLRWAVYALIFLFVGGFTYLQTKSFAFPLGITLAFLILAAVASALTWSIRRFFPAGWNYTWRQSIANLYRPNNQTLVLIVTIGLGTGLISTLFLVQDLLLKQIEYTGAGDMPNMIVFDIQPPQKEAVAKLTTDNELPLKQVVPIVTMRLDNIDGVTKPMDNSGKAEKPEESEEKRRPQRDWEDEDESDDDRPDWVFDREYRVTYRDTLIETEEIVEGTWTGAVGKDGIIYVSLAENLARDMKAKIGSKITFNVQGALLETVVGSIRKVDFRRVQTNFLVVFPKGILEKAPQFYVIVSRVESEAQSARFQRQLVEQFSNVSVVDLTQILKSAKTVLDKVSFVIRFMALFSILTGLIVLISSVVLSKYQRVRESVLLRTIGAHRRQILAINMLEYFMLGSLASLTGIGLSLAGSFALARWSLEIPFEPDWLQPLLLFVSITGLTVLIGLLNSREIVRKPPLEVLRKEV
ncbi:MAG: hypothetical protein RI973_2319 [Bacteroidota bacterium]|jgi:putative ABC transport system permease protein